MHSVKTVDASSEPPFSGSWRDFGLVPALADAIRTHKGKDRYLEQVSTIQREILKSPADRSVLGISATGTGKFLAMVVPALDQMLKGSAKTALVLAVTNPLLDQHVAALRPIVENRALPKRVTSMKVDSKSARRVVQASASGPLMLFSTPHQILELSKGSPEFAAVVSRLDCVIIDEVDAVVADPTFGRQVAAVTAAAPRARLIAVTATGTDAALAKVVAMAHQPVLHIIAGKVHAAKVDHVAAVVHSRDVLPILAMILAKEAGGKIMVFCSTGKFAELAWAYCVAAGIRHASRVHPRLSDGLKKAAQREFQTCTDCVVFCSDFLGRGMDFEGVTLVVQVGYVAPDLYMQRAGRTGRGLVKTGRSVLLLAEKERATAEAVTRSRGAVFRTLRPVPDKRPAVKLPASTVEGGYKAFLGAYKGFMRPLRWTRDDVFGTADAIVRGAGFSVPALDDKYLRKVGFK